MMTSMPTRDARKTIASRGVELLLIAALVGLTACASRSHHVRLASTGRELQETTVEINSDDYGSFGVHEFGPPPPPKKKGFAPSKVRVLDKKGRDIPILDYDILYDAYGGYTADIRVLWEEGFDAKTYAIIGGELVHKEGIKRLTNDELIQAYKYSSGQIPSLDPKIQSVFLSLTKPSPMSGPREYCGQSRNHPAEQRLIKLAGDNREQCKKDYEQTRSVSALTTKCQSGSVLASIDSGSYVCSSESIVRAFKIANNAIDRFAASPLKAKYWSPESPLNIHVNNLSGAFGGTSPCVDYITIDPSTLIDDVTAGAVIPHEIFHRIQYKTMIPSYGDDGGVEDAIVEGGAVWAEDYADDSINYYVAQSGSFHDTSFYDKTFSISLLKRNTCSTERGCNAAYAASLLWKYMSERHGGSDSFDLASELASAVKDNRGYNLMVLKSLRIRGDVPFDECNGLSCKSIWLGFLAANYLHSAIGANDRYRYLEEDEPVRWPRTSPLRESRLYPFRVQGGGSLESSINDWSAKYAIRSGGEGAVLHVNVDWDGNKPAPIALVARVETRDNEVKKLIEVVFEGSIPFERTISLQPAESVAVIVGSREGKGKLLIKFASN